MTQLLKAWTHLFLRLKDKGKLRFKCGIIIQLALDTKGNSPHWYLQRNEKLSESQKAKLKPEFEVEWFGHLPKLITVLTTRFH